MANVEGNGMKSDSGLLNVISKKKNCGSKLVKNSDLTEKKI